MVLRLGVAPDEHVDLASLVGEMGRHLLAEEHAGSIGDGEASFDRIVVRQRDEIHARRAQGVVGQRGIRDAFRKARPAENPFGRAITGARMDVKVGFHQGEVPSGREVSATVAGAQGVDPRKNRFGRREKTMGEA